MSDRRRRAQAHARRSHLCTCGAIVSGNGAKYQHREMHRRNGDGHRYVRQEEFQRRFPEWRGGPQARVIKGAAPRDCENGCGRVAAAGSAYCCDGCALNRGRPEDRYHSDVCPKGGEPAR